MVIVDNEGSSVNHVTVVPLFAVNIGVGVGADGKGPHTYTHLVTKPFIFNSGEDLIAYHPSSKQVLIPVPLGVVAGKGYSGVRWLILKEGYSLKIVNRVQIYSDRPIVLERKQGASHKDVVNNLLSIPVTQAKIKQLFKMTKLSEDIKVEFNMQDRAILDSI
ncbi:MAG: hypothetical protein ABW168_28115 [Sedimenticola sp.]